MDSALDSKAIIVSGDDHHAFEYKTIQVGTPGSGEVRVKMLYASFSEHDSLHESKINGCSYPFLAGYDGVGVIESVGEDITDLTEGDNVVVFMVPQRNGTETNNEKSNVGNDFARAWREGKLWKEAEHLKAYKLDGEAVSGLFGLGTWSEHIVVPETHLVKLERTPDHVDASIGSALCTGMFVGQTAVEVEEGNNCVVFGNNSVALITAFALKNGYKCENVIVVANPSIKPLIEGLGLQFLSDQDEPTEVQKTLMGIVADGYDYTFESSSFQKWGTVALEICHKGFGQAVMLSRPQCSDEKIDTRPFQLVTGRHWISFLQGNVKTQVHGEEVLKTVEKMKDTIGKHIAPESSIVQFDDFVSNWKSATQAPFQRVIIKF